MNNDRLNSLDYCAPRQKHHPPMPWASQGSSAGGHARLEPPRETRSEGEGPEPFVLVGFQRSGWAAALLRGPDVPRHFRIYLCLHFELGSAPESITTFYQEEHLAFAEGAGAAKFIFLGREKKFSCSSGGQWPVCRITVGSFKGGGGLEGKGWRLVWGKPAKCGSCIGDSSRK